MVISFTFFSVPSNQVKQVCYRIKNTFYIRCHLSPAFASLVSHNLFSKIWLYKVRNLALNYLLSTIT